MAARTLKRIFVLNGLTKCVCGHQILTVLTFDHVFGAHYTALCEQLEYRDNLVLVGADDTRQVVGPKGRRCANARKTLVELLHNSEQVRVLMCNGF